jgi:hypothetical protein
MSAKPVKNLPRSPLSAAQRLHNLLKPNKQSSFTGPINIGPCKVVKAAGIFATH